MYPVFLEFATLGQAILELTEEGLFNYMYVFLWFFSEISVVLIRRRADNIQGEL